MSVHDGLLATVIERPDEDEPRLVYADYLEEQGDESGAARAELIRLQIALARLPRRDPQRAALRRREKELLARWAWEWALPLHEHVYEWVYRRGFIEKVSSRLECSGDKIRATLHLAPIRHVRSQGQFGDLDGLVDALPDLHRLTGLELWGLYVFNNDLMRNILASPHLATLRTLILYHDRNGNLVDDDVLIEAMQSPHRANLRYLGVNIDDMWRGPSEAIIRAMLASRYLRRVRKLKFSHTRLDEELVAQLFNAMPLLNRLDLHNCVATPLAWNMILERAQAGRFRWLRLGDTHVTPLALRSDNNGSALSGMPGFVEAFNATPARIDWDTLFIDPWSAGCWRGFTWEDLRRQQESNFDRFLRARDFDGMELYFRELCRRYRGDDLVTQIADVPFERYTAELEMVLRQLSLPANAVSVQVDVTQYEGVAAKGYVRTLEAGDDFLPHDQHSGGDIVGQFSGPLYPKEPADLHNPETKTLDPQSARLYMQARRVAAVARAAARAELPLPLILGPYHHRVW